MGLKEIYKKRLHRLNKSDIEELIDISEDIKNVISGKLYSFL